MEWKYISLCLNSDFSLITYLHYIFVYERAEFGLSIVNILYIFIHLSCTLRKITRKKAIKTLVVK